MRARRNLSSILALGFVVLAVPLLVACSQAGMYAAATATANAAASPVSSPSPISTPNSAPTAAGSIASSPTVTATGTLTDTGIRPTPTGVALPPMQELNILHFVPGLGSIVRYDQLKLFTNSSTDSVLYTVTGISEVVTAENYSIIGVLDYDPTYREWNLTWSSDATAISGTASALPAAVPGTGGYNGGDLLRTGDPILVLRTTTRDNRAHMNLWRWDRTQHMATLLKMVPAAGGAERDASFDADLDLQVADLDGDGIYEVIADNLKNVQVWKWDGSKFVPEGGR